MRKEAVTLGSMPPLPPLLGLSTSKLSRLPVNVSLANFSHAYYTGIDVQKELEAAREMNCREGKKIYDKLSQQATTEKTSHHSLKKTKKEIEKKEK